jgi:hypothetical protein
LLRQIRKRSRSPNDDKKFVSRHCFHLSRFAERQEIGPTSRDGETGIISVVQVLLRTWPAEIDLLLSELSAGGSRPFVARVRGLSQVSCYSVFIDALVHSFSLRIKGNCIFIDDLRKIARLKCNDIYIIN